MCNVHILPSIWHWQSGQIPSLCVPPLTCTIHFLPPPLKAAQSSMPAWFPRRPTRVKPFQRHTIWMTPSVSLSLKIDACTCTTWVLSQHTHPYTNTHTHTITHKRWDVSWLINMGDKEKPFLACCTLHLVLQVLLLKHCFFNTNVKS